MFVPRGLSSLRGLWDRHQRQWWGAAVPVQWCKSIMSKGRVFHLTHNLGYTPWCSSLGEVGYKCGIGSVLVAPDSFCPECRKICLRIHKVEPGQVLELQECSKLSGCTGVGSGDPIQGVNSGWSHLKYFDVRYADTIGSL